MEAILLNEENVHEYDEFLDQDFAENIGRDFYRGLVVCEDKRPAAAMIWELLNFENRFRHTVGCIEWTRISSPEAGEFMLKAYTEIAAADKVIRTYFELAPELIGDNAGVFEAAGFDISETASSCIEVSLSDFDASKILRNLEHPSYIMSLDQIDDRTFRRGIADCIFNVRRRLPEDLARLPITWYDPEISCYEETDEESSGYLLIHRCPSGKLKVELFANWGFTQDSSLFEMLGFSLDKALLRNPPDTHVIITMWDNAERSIALHLFPEAKDLICVRGDRKEKKI